MVPYEIVARRAVFQLTGRPRATVHGLNGPIVTDNPYNGRLSHLRFHLVLVAEPMVDELVECFLAENLVLPRHLTDHVATVEVRGARVRKRLRLAGRDFDVHRVSKRTQHTASPSH